MTVRLTKEELAKMARESRAEDVPRLLFEIEILSDMLRECWRTLDAVATVNTTRLFPVLRREAEALLRKQRAGDGRAGRTTNGGPQS